MLSEQSIITQLQHAFPQDIGDDAAVFKAFGAQSYVITKDLLIENIHFRTQYVNPTALAHKAIHVNLSDIAAMGAKPLFVLLGLSFPKNKEEYIKSFLEYFAQVCQKESITLLGGDTTASPEMIYLSITAVGIAETVRVKYRHTARAGDCIAATGTLGEAYLGLLACEQGCKELTDYKKIFLEPTARIAEGLWLAQHDTVHALMDVSDGLYADLKKLCAASKVAAEIRLEQLSYSENF